MADLKHFKKLSRGSLEPPIGVGILLNTPSSLGLEIPAYTDATLSKLINTYNDLKSVKGKAQQKIRHSLLPMKTGFEKENIYQRELSFSFISLKTPTSLLRSRCKIQNISSLQYLSYFLLF